VKALVFYTSPGGNICLTIPREEAERLLPKRRRFAAIHWQRIARWNGARTSGILGGWFNTSFFRLKSTDTRVQQMDPAHSDCRG